MKEKKKLIAGGGLVVNEKGELLMIYRRGKWDLPKGKLDVGETIEDCAVREVIEETGLTTIERGELIQISHHEYYDRHFAEEVIKETHWFAMKAKGQQKITPQTEEDITDIKWVMGAELDACLEDSYDNVVEVIKLFTSLRTKR